MAENRKVVRISRFRSLNVGVVIFIIIIIYVIFNIFAYLTSETIAEYEVGQGTIAANHVYHALALRDETVVYAGQSGYINYYMKNGSKASVNDVVYSIDTTGDVSKQITTAATDGEALGPEALGTVSQEIELFCNSYDSGDFTAVYTFHDALDSELSQTLSVKALNDLSGLVTSAEANNTFYRKRSDDTGIIVYSIDGFENVTLDNFSAENMIATGYTQTALDARTEVSAGDPVYKRIGSEEWNLVLAVSEDMAKQLSENSSVRIRFCKDDYTATAPFTILKMDGSYYLNLTLQTAMIRYVNDRFVDVELVITEEEGLKIPNTAIVSKEFYTVPKEFFSMGGDSTEPGLLIQTAGGEKDTVKLLTPTVYFEAEDSYYIDDELVSAGDVVVMSNSSKTYTIGQDVDSLTGVYNINKGYAVFKQINILSQNEHYAIVEMRTNYGIALYDHIALDGSKVQEDQLVTK
ncbi:MAG: hypothetical protein NC180_11805 [Muribaculaceae bacterium]|nr:hypothetical protein [Roseburia sp.]MCM1430940.1 hypothetical protein [Muribaculaceae bacterium]MCM1493888.1 hypothetical protein [Muribaculaceae bacterium]